MARVMTGSGVTEPFPIQAATLPDALAGRDVLGRARTGSGKTLAFGLALLTRTAGRRAEPKQPLGLVLVPTRELAQQVSDVLDPYALALGLRLATVVGGLSIGRQATLLRAGADVVVATPGRLTDLVARRDCRLDQVRITVLDEADQMCDMGFLPQVSELLDQVRPGGQRMLFSATLDRNVDHLVGRYLHDPVLATVDRAAGAVATMEHHVLNIHPADKYATATEIAARDGRVLMFLDTKHAVDQFTRHLRGSGIRAAALHSGKSQPQRTHTLAQFKSGEVTVLVATNVAARGIHVDALDLVVNVDPPADPKDYLHRGGRTARAGESGRVVTLVTPGQRRDVNRMMSDAGIRPVVTQVRSGEEKLAGITGAKRPPVADRSAGGNASFRGLGARAPKESRRTAEARGLAEARRAARVRRGR
ncbi:ATP-dependent RNA helicase [Streptomyces pristinaespiralis ATCC 25486]|uniref:ATP-dependent RNA helicase n=1 Tax=Streptomyces pristinaespiralis (strain ATCC 25486 / DSM 40338 / CBS 914.69 / JCM 4507 / KCC S-0507 / NBRC 13074 / NRRL 2958 / 5647) TaxID=457429 RepID=B5HIH6_STRE2|nr:ATP-dependent RNA helicase [Streptomyces pristinaespiralis ATCC 25486]